MRRFRKRRSWQVETIVDIKDQKRLKLFMAHELEFYNQINEALRMKLTANPSLLASLGEHSRAALVEMAAISRPSTKTDVTALALLSEGDARLLAEMVNIRAGIHPVVRKNIAKQVIDFYHDQAVLAIQTVPATAGADQTFRQPLTFLEQFDGTRKRHLQVPRSLIQFTYDDAERAATIKTPYNQFGMTIPNTDDIREKVNFNLMIIHQRPGRPPRSDTPWMLDFRQADTPYLLEYAEMSHPYLGDFHYAARNQRSALT